MNITDPLRRGAQLHPGKAAVARLNRTTASYGELDRTVDAIARRMLEAGLRPGDTVMIAFRPPYMYLALALASARIGVATATVKHPPAACAGCLAPEGVAGLEGVRTIPVSADWFLAPPPTDRGAPRAVAPGCRCDLRVLRVVGHHRRTQAHRHQSCADGEAHRREGTLRAAAGRTAADLRGGSLCRLWLPRHVAGAGPGRPRGLRLVDRRHPCLHPAARGQLPGRRALAAAAPGGGAPARCRSVSFAVPDRGGWQSSAPCRLARRRARACAPTSCPRTAPRRAAAWPRRRWRTWSDHPDAVGRVYAGVDVQAVDAEDRPLPAGTEGILRIRSELCVDRYDDDPVASAQVFRDGWFYPGDLGAVSADGRLDVTGRVTRSSTTAATRSAPT